MDIIVTTPKSQMQAAAQEAADCIAAGGGQYFRRFWSRCYPAQTQPGDRVYYVEDGYIRGFALVVESLLSDGTLRCATTGQLWSPGFFVFMDAASWRWIEPIPMKGFQGFRYAHQHGAIGTKDWLNIDGADFRVLILGGWRDPRPEARA